MKNHAALMRTTPTGNVRFIDKTVQNRFAMLVSVRESSGSGDLAFLANLTQLNVSLEELRTELESCEPGTTREDVCVSLINALELHRFNLLANRYGGDLLAYAI